MSALEAVQAKLAGPRSRLRTLDAAHHAAQMTRQGIPELALYHEDRASKAPTAARIFDQFADTARHHLTNRDGGETVQIFEPQLTDLQSQILDLLSIPQAAYKSTAADS